MLVVETIVRIRREHFVKGKTIKEIARDLEMFRDARRERISYWLCKPAVLELRRSQDGRNAVCLRRAEG
jgi:hypothetical protein